MSIVLASPTETLYSGYTMLVAENTIIPVEDFPSYRRFFPFNLVITGRFTEKNRVAPLAFTDVADPYDTSYPLVDKLNKYVNGEELYAYAGGRRCIQCVYDNLFKVVKVCSCIAPVELKLPEAPPK